MHNRTFRLFTLLYLFNFIRQADELENKLANIKTEICTLYVKTSAISSEANTNGDECNDHDYIENAIKADEPVVQPQEKIKETKKRVKKVTIGGVHILKSDLTNTEEIVKGEKTESESIKDHEQSDEDVDNGNDVDNCGAEADLAENESQIEEILVEQKDQDKKQPKKKDDFKDVRYIETIIHCF